MAGLLAAGLPIAIALAALAGWQSRRRDIPRGGMVIGGLIAGVLWLAITFGPALRIYPTPAALSLLVPWLLFGLFIRPAGLDHVTFTNAD
jgi:hypothetical protein